MYVSSMYRADVALRAAEREHCAKEEDRVQDLTNPKVDMSRFKKGPPDAVIIILLGFSKGLACRA